MSALNIMELDSIRLVMLRVKKCLERLNSNFSFSQNLTRLLKIIYMPCCEQFHIGTFTNRVTMQREIYCKRHLLGLAVTLASSVSLVIKLLIHFLF